MGEPPSVMQETWLPGGLARRARPDLTHLAFSRHSRSAARWCAGRRCHCAIRNPRARAAAEIVDTRAVETGVFLVVAPPAFGGTPSQGR